MNSATSQRTRAQIERNVAIHDKVARKYDAIHGEIFNDVEQPRLRAALSEARAAILTTADPPRALDFGCGSGNLSRHLLDLGFEVTAADISQGFLDLVRSRYPTSRLTTLRMNGTDLSDIPDGSFDAVATYSVLHHVPDYLGAVMEMARVCRPGGVVVIDHEASDEFWAGDSLYTEFRSKALRFDWRKFLMLSNYVHRLRRVFNPRHSNEGDIHVWPDDHIEWTKVKAVMCEHGFEIVREDDYLLYRNLYRREVYDRYVGRCSDTKLMIFRKHN